MKKSTPTLLWTVEVYQNTGQVLMNMSFLAITADLLENIVCDWYCNCNRTNINRTSLFTSSRETR